MRAHPPTPGSLHYLLHLPFLQHSLLHFYCLYVCSRETVWGETEHGATLRMRRTVRRTHEPNRDKRTESSGVFSCTMPPLEYSYLYVFRPGFLSNVWSLGQIRHCMAELQQHLFPWRDIEICDAAMNTPISENSSSSQFNITKAFRLDWPKYYVDVIKSLGGVSYRVKHITSCCQQVALWFYMNMVT